MTPLAHALARLRENASGANRRGVAYLTREESGAVLDALAEAAERYDAVRHAYAVEAQERGRLEAELVAVRQERDTLREAIVDAAGYLWAGQKGQAETILDTALKKEP